MQHFIHLSNLLPCYGAVGWVTGRHPACKILTATVQLGYTLQA